MQPGETSLVPRLLAVAQVGGKDMYLRTSAPPYLCTIGQKILARKAPFATAALTGNSPTRTRPFSARTVSWQGCQGGSTEYKVCTVLVRRSWNADKWWYLDTPGTSVCNLGR